MGGGNFAAEQLATVAGPAAADLAAMLTTERDLRAAAVEDAQGRAGRYAQIAAFLTAFLVSLGAMGLYRRSVRRQLEVAESHLDTRLEAEKTVGRALGELHTLSSGQRVSFIAADIRGRRIALRVWSAAS